MRSRGRVKDRTQAVNEGARLKYWGCRQRDFRGRAFINALSFYFSVLTTLGAFCIRGDFSSGMNRSPSAGSGLGRDDHASYRPALSVSHSGRTCPRFYALGSVEFDSATCPPGRIDRQAADDLNPGGRPILAGHTAGADSRFGSRSPHGQARLHCVAGILPARNCAYPGDESQTDVQ